MLTEEGKSASADFEEVARELISLHTAIKELEDEASNSDSILSRAGISKQNELREILHNCRSILTQLEKLVTKYKSLGTKHKRKWDAVRFGAEGLGELRSKIAFHTSAINLFLTTLGTGSLGRIEKRLDEIIEEIRRGERPESTVNIANNDESEAEAEWNALKNELIEEGFTRQDLEAYKEEIKTRLHELIHETDHDMFAEVPDRDMFASIDQNPSPSQNRGRTALLSPAETSALKRRASSPPPEPRRVSSQPPHELHRSGSCASLAGSIHSDVTEYDGEGRVKRRTIKTTYGRDESSDDSPPRRRTKRRNRIIEQLEGTKEDLEQEIKVLKQDFRMLKQHFNTQEVRLENNRDELKQHIKEIEQSFIAQKTRLNNKKELLEQNIEELEQDIKELEQNFEAGEARLEKSARLQLTPLHYRIIRSFREKNDELMRTIRERDSCIEHLEFAPYSENRAVLESRLKISQLMQMLTERDSRVAHLEDLNSRLESISYTGTLFLRRAMAIFANLGMLDDESNDGTPTEGILVLRPAYSARAADDFSWTREVAGNASNIEEKFSSLEHKVANLVKRLQGVTI